MEEIGGLRVQQSLASVRDEISGQLFKLTAQEQKALCFLLRGVIEGIAETFGAAPLSGDDEAREIARYTKMMQAP